MRFRWMALALGLVLVAFALVLSVGLSAAALGTTLARRASSRLGVELTEGRFRLSLLDGLVLEDGEAVASTGGRRYRLELPRVVFVHRPRALLTGVLEVRAIRFETPRIELVELEEGPEEPAARESDAVSGALDLRFDLEEVVLEDASVHLGDEEGAFSSALEGVVVRFEEIGLAERGPGPLALEGSGSFTARSARLGDLAFSEGRADLYLHEGQVILTLLKFRLGGTPFVAEMRVGLDRSPFGYEVSALGEPFDAAPLVGAPPGSLGEASLLIEVFGRGPAPPGFRAQGSLSLPEGALGDIPILAALNGTLGREVFGAEESRRETLIVYRVRDGYVLFEPFDLASAEAVASIRGRAYLDGKLDLEVEVRAPDVSATSLSVSGTVARPTARSRP